MAAVTLGGARLADAGNNKAVPSNSEAVLASDRFAKFGQLFTLELDQCVALLAIEVVVLGVAVVVFVNCAAAEGHFHQQPCLDEFVQCAIDGRSTDFAARFLHDRIPLEILHQLIGVEVLVPREDEVDQSPPLLRGPLPLALQIFLKPLLRRGRDLNFAEGKIAGHTFET